MKIEKIRFKNLASLEGEWEIDLSCSAFRHSGVFAITGATGAGKSTIFDAIELALFRRTARLAAFASDNEIMTRGTGECYAQVQFSVAEGRYVASWQQKRSRNHPEGRLQDDRHRLEKMQNDGTLLCIAEQKTRTAAMIGALLKMDFDHFSRAIILPQGEFAIFLKTPPQERSEILEQITGTGIYKQISALAYARFARTLEEYKLAAAGIDAIATLSPDEKTALQTQWSESTARQSALSAELSRLTRIQELFLQCKAEQNKIQQFQDEQQTLTPLLNSITAERAGSEQAYHEAMVQYENARPQLLAARALDAERSNRIAEREKLNRAIQVETNSGDALSRELLKLSDTMQKQQHALDSAREYLLQHPNEALLPEQFAGWKAELRNLGEQHLRVEEARRALEEARRRLAGFGENWKSRWEHAFFSEYRRNLQPGLPCPLCGSRSHSEVESPSDRPEFEELESANSAMQLEIQLHFHNDTLKAELRKFEEKRHVLNGQLSVFGIVLETDREIAAATGHLERCLQSFKHHSDAARDAESLLARYRIESGSKQRELARQNERLAQLRAELRTLEESIQQLSIRRKAIFDGEAAEEREQRHTAAIRTAGERLQKARQEAEQLLEKRAKISAGLNSSRQSLGEIQARLSELEAAAILPGELEAVAVQLREAGETAGAAARQLELNARAEAQRDIETEKLRRIGEELERRRELNELIGKQDGGKFRQFAQSLIFRQLLELANRTLRKFTDRYELLSIEESPFDFHVVDHFQCDEIRSIRNLSGGETFLVSMSLALALSRMAGETLQIDTLFLDEGFGTLDEETLLHVLAQIQTLGSDGKLIGIITHVPGIENFVPLSIALVPAEKSGRSRITGPGVSRL